MSILFSFSLCYSALAGIGGNDQCPAASLGNLTLPGTDAGTTVGMAHHFGNPTGGGACSLPCGSYSSGNGRDVIYTFTVGVTGAWTFDLCSTNPAWDNALQIRSGGGCPGASCVAADGHGCDNCAAPYQSKLTAVLSTGVTYYLIVDTYSPVHPGAPYLLRWTPPPVCGNGVIEPGEECDDFNTSDGDGCDFTCQDEPPTNDDCVDHLAAHDGSNAYSLVGSTLDTSTPPPCDINMLNDIWFSYVASCNGYATIATCEAADPDTTLQVYSGCTCGPLVDFDPIACSDDDCADSGLASTILVPVTMDDCYLIRLGGWEGGEPSGVLTISCYAPMCGNNVIEFDEECDDGNTTNADGCDNNCQFEPPVNDLCINATVIQSVPFVDTDVTWAGGTEDEIASCALAIVPTRFGFWYRYLAPGNCQLSVVRTPDAGVADSIAATFTGANCNLLSEVACDDDESSTFQLSAGTQYWLLIGDWATSGPAPTTTLDVAIDCTLPGCGNGTVQPPEECDDSNQNDGDGCSAFCQYEGACCFEDGSCAGLHSLASCIQAGGDFQGGQTTCLPGLCPSCGNGTTDDGEQCDDGNELSGDGCNQLCQWEGACCNGATCNVVTPVQCTSLGGQYQGNDTECPGVCGQGACCNNGVCAFIHVSACTGNFQGFATICAPDPCPDVCGNHELEGIEECDDGNQRDGDGCSSQCLIDGVACMTNADCVVADEDVCTCDRCISNVCEFLPVRFGNVNCQGPAIANLDDILCVLAGFASFAACPNGDLAPGCTGNNLINLDDILRVLSAFGGGDPCNCPQ